MTAAINASVWLNFVVDKIRSDQLALAVKWWVIVGAHIISLKSLMANGMAFLHAVKQFTSSRPAQFGYVIK